MKNFPLFQSDDKRKGMGGRKGRGVETYFIVIREERKKCSRSIFGK